MEEIWKVIKEHPNYEISNLGKVRDVVHKKIKSTSICGGYETVYLDSKSYTIKRLVDNYFTNYINDEIWKICFNHPNYSCSNLGRFKSNITGRILNQYINKKGYACVVLTDEPKIHKKYNAHRLIALTFMPIEDSDNKVVNHINEIKTDNRICNLEWLTNKENLNYSDTGKKIAEKLSKGKINVYNSKGILIITYNSMKEAIKKLGGSKLPKIMESNNRFHKHFYWIREDENLNDYITDNNG